MNSRTISGATILAAALISTLAQAQNPTGPVVPIYRTTVVERSISAINYRYRAEPTEVDFSGTVLLPKSKGRAVVASKQGRTEIDAEFEQLTAPTPFGREYLTYVLWALTPEGRPHNLGEIITNSRNKAHVKVSTDLQAFAMIVTAEPHSAVRQPGDVVVLENKIRRETLGIVEQVNARYELLPRGHYTWEIPGTLAASAPNQPKVSTREYEMLLEIYQAQNAIGIARAARADQYAPDTLAKAESLLAQARQIHARKGDRTMVLQQAREATQSAEDARLIGEQRQKVEAGAKLQAEAIQARRAQEAAEHAAEQARAMAQDSQAEARNVQAQAEAHLNAERTARIRAEADAGAAREQAARAQAELNAVQSSHSSQRREQADQRASRARLLEQLNATSFNTRDTPRGLVVVVPDTGFNGTRLQPEISSETRKLSAILAPYRNLQVNVEGHCDSAAAEPQASARAVTVAEILRSSGLKVSSTDVGDRNPVGPNDSSLGRQENRRVEIVISGDSIGTLALWDRTYPLVPR